MGSQKSQPGSRRGRPRKLPHRDLIKTAIVMISAGSKDSDVRQIWEGSPYNASKRTQQYYIGDVRQALVGAGVITSATSDLEMLPGSPAPLQSRQTDQNLIDYVVDYIEVNGLANHGVDTTEHEQDPAGSSGPSMIAQMLGNSQPQSSSSFGTSVPRQQLNMDNRIEAEPRTPRHRRNTLDSQGRPLETVVEGKASKPRKINRPATAMYPLQSRHVRNPSQSPNTSTSTGVGTSFNSGSTLDRQMWHKYMGQSAPMSGSSFGSSYSTPSSIASESNQRSMKNELSLNDVMSQMHSPQQGFGGRQQYVHNPYDTAGAYVNHNQAGVTSSYTGMNMGMGATAGQYTPGDIAMLKTDISPTLNGNYMDPFLTEDGLSFMLESQDTIKADFSNTTYWSPTSPIPVTHSRSKNIDITGPSSNPNDTNIPVYTNHHHRQEYEAKFTDQTTSMMEDLQFDDFDMDIVPSLADISGDTAPLAERSHPIDIANTSFQQVNGAQSLTESLYYRGFAGTQSPAHYVAAATGQLTTANLQLCPYHEHSTPEYQREMAAWVEQQTRLYG